jgi:hypothetical protein
MANFTQPDFTQLDVAMAEQEDWIRDHGGDLAGYVKRYGSKDDPNHFGDGGEAIFEADVAAFVRLQNRRYSHRR